MSHTTAVLDARDEIRGCKESLFAYQSSEQGVMVPSFIDFFFDPSPVLDRIFDDVDLFGPDLKIRT